MASLKMAKNSERRSPEEKIIRNAVYGQLGWYL